jgi:hypothetical protein
MLNTSIGFTFIVALPASTLPGLAQAQAQQGVRASLAGAFRCEPQPSPRPWPGHHGDYAIRIGPRAEERSGWAPTQS